MEIEPLASLLHIYKDKNKCLHLYLPKTTTIKLKDHIYHNEDEETLYLNENVILIKKNNGMIEKKGKIICITDEKIIIKTSNQYNITFDKEEYYLFIKQKKNKKK